ncbi:MAG: hypothetical protein ACM3YO_03805 [Bacteroidota bacterium]
MKRSALTALAVLLLATPAAASTMPKVDFNSAVRYFGLGLGNDNLSASLDVPIAGNFMLGGSIGLPGLFGITSPYPLWDLRGVYQFVDGARRDLSIGGIAGLWGGRWFNDQFTHLELGFGLAYPFTPQLVGRLNLMVPYYGSQPGPYYFGFGGPAAGAEIGYTFNYKVDGTLGVTGQGTLLGLSIRF